MTLCSSADFGLAISQTRSTYYGVRLTRFAHRAPKLDANITASSVHFDSMLAKDFRLRHEKDIAKTLKSKAGAFDTACGVKVVKNNLTASRFAVVVGTKVSKKAVDRNRIRRQYREIVRSMMKEIKPGFDVILLTARPALELDYHQKEAKLRSTLHRAKLL